MLVRRLGLGEDLSLCVSTNSNWGVELDSFNPSARKFMCFLRSCLRRDSLATLFEGLAFTGGGVSPDGPGVGVATELSECEAD